MDRALVGSLFKTLSAITDKALISYWEIDTSKGTAGPVGRGGYDSENAHTHELHLDEKGNGVTSIDGGHFHTVTDYYIEPHYEFDETAKRIVGHNHEVKEDAKVVGHQV